MFFIALKTMNGNARYNLLSTEFLLKDVLLKIFFRKRLCEFLFLLFCRKKRQLMSKQGIHLSTLPKINGKYIYRRKAFSLNHPIRSTAKGKKKMVLATKRIHGEIHVKLIHFGALGYGHNYSMKAKKNYLARSAGIRDKSGRLPKRPMERQLLGTKNPLARPPASYWPEDNLNLFCCNVTFTSLSI